MPSSSLHEWRTVRAASLDEIEAAHSSLGGTGPGRRYATQQVNHAYVVLLSGQFQGFCRDLHTECARFIAGSVSPVVLRPAIVEGFLRDRKLDRGNPNPGNIGADFGRFNVELWTEIYQRDARNRSRRAALDALNDWRNAIAHQDFTRTNGAAIQLQQVRKWRRATENLAADIDAVMSTYLTQLVGSPPW